MGALSVLSCLWKPLYVDYWRSQQAKQQRRRHSLPGEAWREVEAIATLLKQDFGETQVIVFDSLLSDRSDSQSDLDIAAAGIGSEQY